MSTGVRVQRLQATACRLVRARLQRRRLHIGVWSALVVDVVDRGHERMQCHLLGLNDALSLDADGFRHFGTSLPFGQP